VDSPKKPSSPPGNETAAAGPVPTNVVGLTALFTDPLWRIPVRLNPARLARMTDPQLWTAFDSCAVTQAESTMVRYELHRLKVEAGSAPPDRSGWTFSLRKIYSSAAPQDDRGRRVPTPVPLR
jgi:hypothetical protein